MGLKDQQLALKWVHNHINSFGGDPNKITVFGESAGASSIAYHLALPGSKGLFQRAIMQVCQFLCPSIHYCNWGQKRSPTARKGGNFSKFERQLSWRKSTITMKPYCLHDCEQ